MRRLGTTGAATLLLFVMLAGSAGATSSVPKCTSLSRTAMASLAQTGPLTLAEHIGNLCEFTGTGEHKGHYHTTFAIQLIPYIRSVWTSAKSKSQFSAARNGSDFGQFTKTLFFVSGEVTGKGLQPCDSDLGTPGHGESEYGPVCESEPSEAHFTAYGNGVDPRTGAHIMVTAGVTGQQGDVHLSHLLTLVQRVLSGKIH